MTGPWLYFLLLFFSLESCLNLLLSFDFKRVKIVIQESILCSDPTYHYELWFVCCLFFWLPILTPIKIIWNSIFRLLYHSLFNILIFLLSKYMGKLHFRQILYVGIDILKKANIKHWCVYMCLFEGGSNFKNCSHYSCTTHFAVIDAWISVLVLNENIFKFIKLEVIPTFFKYT